MQLNWAIAALVAAMPLATARTCRVVAGGDSRVDDAPAIISAFKHCGRNGRVIFDAPLYHINTIMNITWLKNVEIDIHGTLLVCSHSELALSWYSSRLTSLKWSTDIQYWLKHSMPVGFQNQSTAFILGGDGVKIDGFNQGTFNGNGDYWYEFISKQPNQSNYPGRPHAITFNGLTNSVVRGLRFIRSQMW